MNKEFKVSITIDDLAKILGVRVITTPIMKNKEVVSYSVYLESVEVVDGPFLVSESGRGATVYEAEKDYFKNVSGKNLRVSTRGGTFQMPSLTE